MTEITLDNMPSADEYNDAAQVVLTFILTSDDGRTAISQIKTMMDYTEGLCLVLRKALGESKKI